MESSPEKPVDSFETMITDRIRQTETFSDLQRVIDSVYNLGQQLTTSDGEAYSRDGLSLDKMMDEAIPLNHFTSRYGLRDKVNMLRERTWEENQYQEAVPIFDGWLEYAVFSGDLDSRADFFCRLDDIKEHLAGQAIEKGEDYSAYERRLDEWRVEANRLVESLENQTTIIPLIPALHNNFLELNNS